MSHSKVHIRYIQIFVTFCQNLELVHLRVFLRVDSNGARKNSGMKHVMDTSRDLCLFRFVRSQNRMSATGFYQPLLGLNLSADAKIAPQIVSFHHPET